MAEKPSDSPEKPAPEPEKTEAAKPIALTPRQSAATGDRPASPTGVPVDPAAINEQLMTALAQVLTAQGAPVAPSARDERGLISREEKRFRRGGTGGRSDALGEKSDASSEGVAKVPPDSESEKTPRPAGGERSTNAAEDQPGPIEPSERRQRQERSEPTILRPSAPKMGTAWRLVPPWQRNAILAVLGVMLALVGFMFGRLTSPAPSAGGIKSDPRSMPSVIENAPARGTPRLAEPAEIALIDEAMIAQTNGDFGRAEKLLRQLLLSAPDLVGTQTALALLNLQKGDAANAQSHIKSGIDAGDDAGRLYGLRGAVQAQLNQSRRAYESFELGTRATPHNFKPFFLLAEMLRRGGKNQQALDRFDQALARVHEQSDEDAMQFKKRLTLIAMGRGDELDAELKQQLAQSPPSGDWLLLAMAAEAQKGNFKAAAGHLERASQLMSADWMVERLRDFFLYQWCYEKELEPYFRPLQKRLSVLRQREPAADSGKDVDERLAPAAPPAASIPPKP